jgi:hypothetical protein
MTATVSQSTRELALRIALGADATDLLRLVMSRSALLTALGILIGLAVAPQVTRLLGFLNPDRLELSDGAEGIWSVDSRPLGSRTFSEARRLRRAFG